MTYSSLRCHVGVLRRVLMPSTAGRGGIEDPPLVGSLGYRVGPSTIGGLVVPVVVDSVQRPIGLPTTPSRGLGWPFSDVLKETDKPIDPQPLLANLDTSPSVPREGRIIGIVTPAQHGPVGVVRGRGARITAMTVDSVRRRSPFPHQASTRGAISTLKRRERDTLGRPAFTKNEQSAPPLDYPSIALDDPPAELPTHKSFHVYHESCSGSPWSNTPQVSRSRCLTAR